MHPNNKIILFYFYYFIIIFCLVQFVLKPYINIFSFVLVHNIIFFLEFLHTPFFLLLNQNLYNIAIEKCPSWRAIKSCTQKVQCHTNSYVGFDCKYCYSTCTVKMQMFVLSKYTAHNLRCVLLKELLYKRKSIQLDMRNSFPSIFVCLSDHCLLMCNLVISQKQMNVISCTID